MKEKPFVVNGVKLTAGQIRALLAHALYAGTLGADLDTTDGCEQAATCVVDALGAVRRGFDAAILHEHDRFELSHLPLGVMH